MAKIMSRISRYKFLKKIFNNYIVLIYKDKRYYTYGIDAYMFYHKCNKDIRKVERLRINYVIVEGLEEVDKKEYKNNRYSHYFYRCGVLRILDKMVKTR